ncbi:hypothetical protein [Streptomyces eurythermus]
MSSTSPEEPDNSLVSRLVSRRRMLLLGGAAGAVALGGAGAVASAADRNTTGAGTLDSVKAAASASSACMSLTTEQIEGPYYIDYELFRKNVVEELAPVPGADTGEPGVLRCVQDESESRETSTTRSAKQRASATTEATGPATMRPPTPDGPGRCRPSAARPLRNGRTPPVRNAAAVRVGGWCGRLRPHRERQAGARRLHAERGATAAHGEHAPAAPATRGERSDHAFLGGHGQHAGHRTSHGARRSGRP